MGKLIQKLNLDMPFIKNQCMFVYADADLDSNQKMQEPLQKLYQYENQPDMREKIREYINELEIEIKKLEDELCKPEMFTNLHSLAIESRLETLQEVINDLKGRSDEIL